MFRFIASTCGLEPSSSTDKFSNRRSCCQLGRNTCDIRGKSAYAQFDKTQFFFLGTLNIKRFGDVFHASTEDRSDKDVEGGRNCAVHFALCIFHTVPSVLPIRFLQVVFILRFAYFIYSALRSSVLPIMWKVLQVVLFCAMQMYYGSHILIVLITACLLWVANMRSATA